MPTRAQRLRKNPAPAEIRLWKLIEPFRAQGHHFRKQVPLGPYVADFACHGPKLVIEIDGDTHYTEAGMTKDRERTAALARHGFTVLRFANHEVMTNPEGVYLVLAAALANGTPNSPSLQGGG